MMSEEEIIKICQDLWFDIDYFGIYYNKEGNKAEQAIDGLLQLYNKQKERIKELEEYKKIAELTKISCCTAQNCEALNNVIREGLENNKLKERIEELEEIEKEHQKQNGELQEKIKELENINEKLYKDNQKQWEERCRLAIELDHNTISKDKIKAKIEEKQNRINKLHPASDCVIIDDLENQIKVLQELLED